MTTATMNAQAQSGAKGLDAGKNAEAKVNWKCPTQSNVITSPFGPRNVKGGSNPHKGIDLRAQAGASYYAAADGKVTRAGGGDYNTIVIDHGGGIQTRYLHASSVSAKVGNVKAGDRLAAAGGKGPKGVDHYAYHLHFDVIKNGTYIDPEAFLQSQGVSLVRKGGEGKTENGTTGGKKNNNAAQGGRQMNAEGHPIYYPKGAKETLDIINWNKGRNYTVDYIKSFQKVIGTKVDGGIGTDTVNAIRHYQEKNGLGQDGKWGKDCADHAKLERKYNSGSAGNTTNASSGGGASAVGGGTAPEGASMTNQKYGGMYLSKYHIGLSDSSNNCDRWRLHPTLQAKLSQLDALLQKEGLTFELFEGMRSPQRQQKCKQNGASKLGAWYGRHNYGLAADYVLKDNGKWSWETGKAGYMAKWKKLGQLGKSVGLTWGGDWKKFCDLPHFELSSAPSTANCKTIYSKKGIDGLWAQC